MSESRMLLAGCAAILFALLVAVLAGWWRIDGDRTPVVEIPESPALPDPNAFDLLVRAAEAVPDKTAAMEGVTGRRDPETGGWFELPIEEREQIVAANEEVLDLVREALRLPFVYPDLYVARPGTEQYRMGDFRMLAWHLALESDVRRARERYGAAMSSALDCVELGKLIGHRSTVIGALTGNAIAGIGRRAASEVMPYLNEAELKSAALRLESLGKTALDMPAIVEEERRYILTSLITTFDGPEWRLEIVRLDDVIDPDNRWVDYGELPRDQRFWVQWHSWRYHKGRILEAHDRMIEQVQAAVEKPFPQGDRLWPEPDRLLPEALGEVSQQTFRRMWFFLLVDEAAHEMLRAKAGLRLWRMKEGEYPESLDALKGAPFERLPRDPFTASDTLLYRREGDGYILYSVGPNGIDNGGQPMVRSEGRPGLRYRPQPDLTGDLVAEVNVLRARDASGR